MSLCYAYTNQVKQDCEFGPVDKYLSIMNEIDFPLFLYSSNGRMKYMLWPLILGIILLLLRPKHQSFISINYHAWDVFQRRARREYQSDTEALIQKGLRKVS